MSNPVLQEQLETPRYNNETSILNVLQPMLTQLLTPWTERMQQMEKHMMQMERELAVVRINEERIEKQEGRMDKVLSFIENTMMKEPSERKIPLTIKDRKNVELKMKIEKREPLGQTISYDKEERNQISGKKEQWQSPKKTVKSYSSTLKNLPADIQEAGLSLLNCSNRFVTLVPTREIEPKNEVEKKTGLRAFHVFGLKSMPISELKKKLRDFKIMTNQCANIAFIGRSIAEFLVYEEYAPKFEAQLKQLGDAFTIARDWDPTAFNKANATAEDTEKAEDNFSYRAAKTMVETEKQSVFDYYAQLAAMKNSIKVKTETYYNRMTAELKFEKEMAQNEMEARNRMKGKEKVYVSETSGDSGTTSPTHAGRSGLNNRELGNAKMEVDEMETEEETDQVYDTNDRYSESEVEDSIMEEIEQKDIQETSQVELRGKQRRQEDPPAFSQFIKKGRTENDILDLTSPKSRSVIDAHVS
jgi:hypothetical protein